jgi:hypothetical protein
LIGQGEDPLPLTGVGIAIFGGIFFGAAGNWIAAVFFVLVGILIAYITGRA